MRFLRSLVSRQKSCLRSGTSALCTPACAYSRRPPSGRRRHHLKSDGGAAQGEPVLEMSVRATEKFVARAEQRLARLLSDGTVPPASSVEAELQEAMYALEAFNALYAQPPQRPSREGSRATPSAGVSWTAASSAPTRTLADLQRSASEACAGLREVSRTDPRAARPQRAQTDPDIPLTSVERRTSMRYAMLQHWLVVAAKGLRRHQLSRYQPQLFALLVPPRPPRFSATSSPLLARSLWRRGAKAYVELLVALGGSPQSRQEWCHVRAVLGIAESVWTMKRSDGREDAPGRFDSDPCAGARLVTVSAREDLTGSRRRGSTKTPVHHFAVFALPFLPSSEAWAYRVHGQPRFAAQRDWVSWRTLHAMWLWSATWDSPPPPTSPSTMQSVRDTSETSPTPTAHVESRDVLAVLTACLHEEANDSRHAHADTEAVRIVTTLKEAWERSRAAERAFPALAAACGVDKTRHERLVVEGHTVVMRPAEDAEDARPGETSSALLPFASTTGQYQQWAAQGQWTRIRADLDAQWARLRGVHRGGHPSAIESTSPFISDAGAALSSLWTMWPPLRVPTLLYTRSVSRLPEVLAKAPETAAERAMIVHPPTPGLDVLAHIPSSVATGEVARSEKSTADGSAGEDAVLSPSSSERCAVAKAVETASLSNGRQSSLPSVLVVELRRRLWCLAKTPLPSQIARTVVCFTHQPSMTAVASVVGHSPNPHHRSHNRNKGGGGDGGRSARVLPFVWRVPAKEWLPWYLVASVGLLVSSHTASSTGVVAASTSDARGEDGNTLLASVRALQAGVWPSLFRPLADYAAFTEYCTDIFVQLARVQGAARHEGTSEDVWAQVAWWLFRPCPARCRAEDAAHAHTRAVAEPHTFSALASEWDSLQSTPHRHVACGAAPTPPTSGDVYADTWLDPSFLDFLVHKAGQMRNYHVSLALEALSRVDGVSLVQLLSALKEEYDVLGPVVLGPESAVAVTTALVMLMLPVAMTASTTTHATVSERAPCEDDVSEATRNTVTRLLETYRSTHLYFAVPTQKAHTVASYFKAIHDPYYLSRCVSPSSAAVHSAVHGWEGAEALLVGRSLRLVDRFPTTVDAAFFHVQQEHEDATVAGRVPPCACTPPALTYAIFCVDVVKALDRFLAQQRRQEQPHAATSAEIVATDLPCGLIAVNKPAGVNCTLHAAYPSLIPFLAMHAPWRSHANARGDRCREAHLSSRLLASTVPVLHQHGLINRIDVGTSGLVLCVRDHPSLHSAVQATLTHHRFGKTYRALVQYTPPPSHYWAALSTWYLPSHGVIASPVYAHGVTDPAAFVSLQVHQHLQSDCTRKRLSAALLDRRPALTRFRVLEYFPRHGVYYVEVALDSGRRHQIRQHFASVGHPLVGDVRYHSGAAKHGARACWGLTRPALHAAALHIHGPPRDEVTAQRPRASPEQEADNDGSVVVKCPLPEDMERVLTQLRATQ